MSKLPVPALLLLFAINAINFFDRQILAAVTEPIRKEWSLSDTQLGWLGTAFTLLYAVAGIPMGRLADRRNRTRLLAAGTALWSALTYASGLACGFWSLFTARLGVGVGEAVCAPASTSLIGDLFPADRRARAMSVFMLGLPVGVALSYAVSGTVAQHYGWRTTFFLAGLPGLLLAFGALLVAEPPRAPKHPADRMIALRVPAFWWIVLSGALHNFSMYAFTFFLPAFLTRQHGVSVEAAGWISGVVVGVVGGLGMLAAGWLADRAFRSQVGNRLLVAALSILISVPATYAALDQPRGALAAVIPLLGAAFFLLYSYYGVVYAAIQDIARPDERGRTMAAYLFALYLLGASAGPAGVGWLSDHFAAGAARAADPAAAGLHRAMYVVPTSGIVLSAVLFAAARSARRLKSA